MAVAWGSDTKMFNNDDLIFLDEDIVTRTGAINIKSEPSETVASASGVLTRPRRHLRERDFHIRTQVRGTAAHVRCEDQEDQGNTEPRSLRISRYQMFAVRVFSTDNYLCKPIPDLDLTYSDFRATDVKQCPVIRIFGATPSGQKCCVHIHGVFPYFYVPCGQEDADERYLRRFAASLDKALNIAMGRDPVVFQHVFKITVVSGTPFYGYHEKQINYMKIYLYNPADVKKAADLLLRGAVMNRMFQPHEAHIPYSLQFLIDYNLYGMNFLYAEAARFRYRDAAAMEGREERLTLSDIEGIPLSERFWDVLRLPKDMLMDKDMCGAMSRCELEVDVAACDLMNPVEVQDRVEGGNPGLAAIWEEERHRREDLGLSTDDMDSPLSINNGPLEEFADWETLLQQWEKIYRVKLGWKDVDEDSTSEQPRSVSSVSASQVADHTSLSQQLNDFLNASVVEGGDGEVSGDSTDVEDSEANETIINEQSIRLAMSRGESFVSEHSKNEKARLLPMTSWADVLTDEVEDTKAVQAALTECTALEEQDSVLAPTINSRDGSCHSAEASDDENVVSIEDEVDRRDSESRQSKDGEDEALDSQFWDRFLHSTDDYDDEMVNLTQEDLFDDVPQLDGTKDSPKSPTSKRQKVTRQSPRQQSSPQRTLEEFGIFSPSTSASGRARNARSPSRKPVVSLRRLRPNEMSPPIDCDLSDSDSGEREVTINISSDEAAAEKPAQKTKKRPPRSSLTLKRHRTEKDGEQAKRKKERSGEGPREEAEVICETPPSEIRFRDRNLMENMGRFVDKLKKSQEVLLKKTKKQRRTPDSLTVKLAFNSNVNHRRSLGNRSAADDGRGTPRKRNKQESSDDSDIQVIDVLDEEASTSTSNGSPNSTGAKKRRKRRGRYPVIHLEKIRVDETPELVEVDSESDGSENGNEVKGASKVAPEDDGDKEEPIIVRESKEGKEKVSRINLGRKELEPSIILDRKEKDDEEEVDEPIIILETMEWKEKMPRIRLERWEGEEAAITSEKVEEIAEERSLAGEKEETEEEEEEEVEQSFVSEMQGEEGCTPQGEHKRKTNYSRLRLQYCRPLSIRLNRVDSDGSYREAELSPTDTEILPEQQIVSVLESRADGPPRQIRVRVSCEDKGKLRKIGRESLSLTRCKVESEAPPARVTGPLLLDVVRRNSVTLEELTSQPVCVIERSHSGEVAPTPVKRKERAVRCAWPDPSDQDLFACSEGPTDNGVCGLTWKPSNDPPARAYVVASLPDVNLPFERHQHAFWSSELKSRLPDMDSWACDLGLAERRHLELMGKVDEEEEEEEWWRRNEGRRRKIWTPNRRPPPRAVVASWLSSLQESTHTSRHQLSQARAERLSLARRHSQRSATQKRKLLLQTRRSLRNSTSSVLEGPTLDQTADFRLQSAALARDTHEHERQFVTLLSVEVFAESRGTLLPDPQHDSVLAVAYSIQEDDVELGGNRMMSGIVVVDAKRGPRERRSIIERTGAALLCDECHCVSKEAELFEHLVKIIQKYDPDIFVGYEIEDASWGYLLKRSLQKKFHFEHGISRILAGGDRSANLNDSVTEARRYATQSGEVTVTGRVVLNLWRILRHEVTLNIYTLENCAYHVLHERIPKFSPAQLTQWFASDLTRWRTLDYFLYRSRANLSLLSKLGIVERTSEFARVFGIEFYHVMSRGSQFRVESMMLRLAKPANFVAVSPSVHQRARQRAPECIPLTLEPESKLYVDPVVVLDFQSLYPSIMIAYNYCFSTALGRMSEIEKTEPGTAFDFGCTQLSLPPEAFNKIKDKVNISPNGVVFVKPEIRKGVISAMVEEILKTRMMVKKSMKKYPDRKDLHRLMDSRQLGLKLIANVTFGYTSATFSGRMPCVEVGDSIVRKARETLERAIMLVNTTQRWRAKVVYGDTDSLFILLPGRSLQQAFTLGEEMAQAVTDANPSPVKLKFEKVYLPCLLEAKKRYVGMAFEERDQEGKFDAKGIETVRRDGCPAVSKILEKTLRLLFDTRDLSKVKDFVIRQCAKVLEGQINLQDYIIAKEYRGMRGYKPAAAVPALQIARQLLERDIRAEPHVGERVPYVVAHGSPGEALIHNVHSPEAFLSGSGLRVNTEYYVTKQILPPLHRALSLVGVDVHRWYSEIPRRSRVTVPVVHRDRGRTGTLADYFQPSTCVLCASQVAASSKLCESCLGSGSAGRFGARVRLMMRARQLEQRWMGLADLCSDCTQGAGGLNCVSIDCPVLPRQRRAHDNVVRESDALRSVAEQLF